jgi:general secretion pathway protein M
MIAALSHGLARRSARERLLLAALVLVALPVAAVFLGAQPLMDQRNTARAALAEAEAERGWYVARQAEIAALPVNGETRVDRPAAPVGLGGIEARLIEAGLRHAVSQLANAQGNSVVLEFESVGFEMLMRWLDGVETNAGYRVSALQILRGDGEGQVEAELRLEPLP